MLHICYVAYIVMAYIVMVHGVRASDSLCSYGRCDGAFAFPGHLQRRTAYAHVHTHASTNVCGTDSMHLCTGVVAHIAMAYIVMAYRVTAYTVMACAAMAYITMVPCTCLHKCT